MSQTESNPQESSATADDQARELTTALREAGVLGEGDQVREVSQLSGGWSRHSFTADAEFASGEQRSFIVRAEAPGGVLETDIAAEYALYHALDSEPNVRTPSVYYFDGSSDNSFGNRFMVMERVEGRAANTFRRKDREWLEADWNGSRGIARDMVENLARLHSISVEGLPPGAVPELGYLQVVDRWQTVYEDKHLGRDPVTEEAFDWLRSRVPSEEHVGIVHGDYRIGNALVDDGRLTAILDWELAYIGDVRFDLGYLALERLAGKHLRPVTSLLNAFAESDWFFDEYARLTGRKVDPEVVRTFSVLAIMMLLSTHYMSIWMYSQDRSSDFRFVWNRFGLPGLRQDLTRLMQW